MTAVIFGASGQDGQYLTRLLRTEGVTVIGASRSGPARAACGDVSDYAFVERLLSEHQPTYIFHLAANSTTRHDALIENQRAMVQGTVNVLEAVKRTCPASRVFITGSGLQFRNEGKPISEQDPFDMTSAYALARVQSVQAARYFRSLGVRAYVGYLFHHESPLRPISHVSQKIATAVRQIANGKPACLEIGDVTVEKEWSFAGDIVQGMLTLVRQEDVFEATIGSGVAHPIRAWLEACFELINLDWESHVCVRTDFRPEYRRLVCNPSTIRSLHWSAEVDLANLARMMVRGV